MSAVIVLSGGLDSTVLLWSYPSDEIACAVSIDYGQRHGARELRAARDVVRERGVPHVVVDLTGLRAALPGSSLTSDDIAVPHGHYEDASMRATVVPNRNMILLAVAGGVAVARGADVLAYGAHAGDHAVYPDCRPEFAHAMSNALALCHYTPVRLERPFVRMSKAEVVAHGRAVGAPMDRTWSCYEGGELHCGRCGTCVERREAFQVAGVPDLTSYIA